MFLLSSVYCEMSIIIDTYVWTDQASSKDVCIQSNWKGFITIGMHMSPNCGWDTLVEGINASNSWEYPSQGIDYVTQISHWKLSLTISVTT